MWTIINDGLQQISKLSHAPENKIIPAELRVGNYTKLDIPVEILKRGVISQEYGKIVFTYNTLQKVHKHIFKTENSLKYFLKNNLDFTVWKIHDKRTNN